LFYFDTIVRLNCFWILFQKTSDFTDVDFLAQAAFRNLRSLLVEVASSTKGGLAMTMAGNLLPKIELCTARKIIHTHPRDSDTSFLPPFPPDS